jgi:hypothetical protein
MLLLALIFACVPGSGPAEAAPAKPGPRANPAAAAANGTTKPAAGNASKPATASKPTATPENPTATAAQPTGAAASPAVPADADATAEESLAEGAALKLGTAAKELAEVAGRIAGEGRIGRLSELRSDADDVVRRADLLVTLTAQEGAETGAGDAPASAPNTDAPPSLPPR